ncbi:MAG: hypothetical protein ACSHX6_16895 [Akkermansiaceae bacterium]
MKYNNLSDSLKAKGEYQFLRKALSDAKHGIHQGVYVVTPSGELIKQINWGWPVPDEDEMNAQLGESIAIYKKMPKAERLGKVMLGESDRSMPLLAQKKAPEAWLELRNTTRSYGFEDMELFDIRHPAFVTIDKLWFSREEKKKFVPSSASKGSREKVAPEALERMLVNSHLITGRSAWWSEHTLKAEMEMEVVSSSRDQLVIHYQGEFKQMGTSKWCKDSYSGSLLGKATWNPVKNQFSSFEWVSLGEHGLDKLLPNMHRGTTKTVSVASKLILDPQNVCEQGIGPASWPNSYTKEMQAQVK